MGIAECVSNDSLLNESKICFSKYGQADKFLENISFKINQETVK